MADKKAVSGNALDYKLIKRIFKLAAPHKKVMWWALILTVVNAVLGPVRPLLIQETLDNQVANGDYNGLIWMTVIMIALLLFHTLIMFLQSYITSWLGQNVIEDLRNKVFKHISRLRLKYIDKTQVGTLTTRTVTDTETLADVFSQGVINIVGDFLQVLVIVAVMFYTDWKLSLASLSVLPILLISSYIFKEKVKQSFQEVRKYVQKLNAFVQEHVTGMQIVQIFNREEEELKRFKAINKEHRDANIKSVLYYAIFIPVVDIITAMSTGILVWWGVKGVINYETSFGVIIMFILFINMFFRPIRQIADRFNTLQMGMVASERLFALLDDNENLEKTGTYIPEKEEFKGKIEFDKVWFAYNDQEWVLKNLSFNLEAGKTLALVGATGAGKSSIINLISRFYEISEGSIKVDDKDIREYDLDYLRSKTAAVLQDVFLFSGSIKENVNIFSDSISPEKIEEASKLIGADKFIQNLAGKYDYKVMERGASLSVGQRQMISFVRALAFDPKILILDEATSSVDSETEEMIQNAIKVLMKGRTSIVIAHRLSTIQDADEIIVLDKGEIVERGTHQELLKLGAYYEKLYRYQFSHSNINEIVNN